MIFLRGAACAALGLVAMGLGAQTLDPELKKSMDATGLKYSVTKSGNAAVTYALDDNRTQVVYVTSKPTQVGDHLQLREIWSNAGEVPEDVSFDVLLAMLTAGGNENLGAWNLEQTDGGYLAYYSARLPELEPAQLSSALEYIASVADAKEAELSDADDN